MCKFWTSACGFVETIYQCWCQNSLQISVKWGECCQANNVICRWRQIQAHIKALMRLETECCLCCCGFTFITTFYSSCDLRILFEHWKSLLAQMTIKLLFISIDEAALNKKKSTGFTSLPQLTKKSFFSSAFVSPLYYSDGRLFLHKSTQSLLSAWSKNTSVSSPDWQFPRMLLHRYHSSAGTRLDTLYTHVEVIQWPELMIISCHNQWYFVFHLQHRTYIYGELKLSP